MRSSERYAGYESGHIVEERHEGGHLFSSRSYMNEISRAAESESQMQTGVPGRGAAMPGSNLRKALLKVCSWRGDVVVLFVMKVLARPRGVKCR